MSNLIGDRIRKAMLKTGMKQAEIIKRTGINKGALSSYISGRYKPKDESIDRLAYVLNVNPDWLRGKDVPEYTLDNLLENTNLDTLDSLVRTDKEKKFIKYFDVLDIISLFNEDYVKSLKNQCDSYIDISSVLNKNINTIESLKNYNNVKVSSINNMINNINSTNNKYRLLLFYIRKYYTDEDLINELSKRIEFQELKNDKIAIKEYIDKLLELLKENK